MIFVPKTDLAAGIFLYGNSPAPPRRGKEDSAVNKYVLSVLVKNHSGVLRRVSGLFARRGYNIESLTVGVTENPKVSRMTVVVCGDEYIVDQITKQVSKLVEVFKVEILPAETSVFRELLLVKVKTSKDSRAEILEISNIFRSRVVDVAADSLVLEATGDTNKLTALLKMLEPFTILELVRTGLTALQRGAAVFGKEEKEKSDA